MLLCTSTASALFLTNMIINGVDANSIGTGEEPKSFCPVHGFAQEFIVQTSMYDASAGRSAGGNVAAVTKSGTTGSMAMPTSSCGIPFWMPTISS